MSNSTEYSFKTLEIMSARLGFCKLAERVLGFRTCIMKHTLKHNNTIYLYKNHSQAIEKHIDDEGTSPYVFTRVSYTWKCYISYPEMPCAQSQAEETEACC